jgi:hypothetical protein
LALVMRLKEILRRTFGTWNWNRTSQLLQETHLPSKSFVPVFVQACEAMIPTRESIVRRLSGLTVPNGALLRCVSGPVALHVIQLLPLLRLYVALIPKLSLPYITINVTLFCCASLPCHLCLILHKYVTPLFVISLTQW